MSEMEDAAGSADAEMTIIQDSLEYKINALKQTWVGTLQTLVDRGDFGTIVDNLTKVSEGIGFITSKLGLLKTAIIGVSTVIGSQKLGIFNTNDDSTIIGGLKSYKQNKIDADQYKGILNTASTFYKSNPNYLLDADFADISKYPKLTDTVRNNLVTIQNEVKKAGGTGEDAFNKISSSMESCNGIVEKGIGVVKKFGATFVNALTSMAISTAISFIVQGVLDVINSEELLAKKTQEIASNFRDQKDELTDYADKLVEYRTKMEDSASTTQEVADATSDLYDIQNDLISQYGGYHTGIDLVNGDLETQLELLREINQENANKALAEINSELSNKSKALNLFANLGGGKSGLGVGWNFLDQYWNQNKSFKNALSDTFFGGDWGDTIMGTSEEQITKMVNEYKGGIKTTNDAVKDLLRSYSDVFEETSDGTFKAIGNIYEVNEAVSKLQQSMEDLGMTEDKSYKQLGKIYKDTNDKINQYGESYKTIVEANILKNEELTEQYNRLSNAYNKYSKAQDEGNQKEVEKYEDEYVKAIAAIQDSDIADQYKDYFMSMYPEMQQAVDSWDLETKIKASLDPDTFLNNELQKLTNWNLEEYADQIKDGALHKFGNIDMDKRVILEWSQELKDYYSAQLASWDYDPEIGSIDTVFGGSAEFDGHEIAFSPILQTENGEGVFLSKDNLYEYINKVMEEAGKDGEISAEEILAIDAEGVGLSVGEDYIRGVIAGVDNYSGIAAEKIGELMHFSGEYGAYNLAKQQSSGYETLTSDLMRNSAEEIKTRYNYYKQVQEAGNLDFVDSKTVEEFQALENAAANAGMTVDNFIDSVKAIPDYSDGMQALKDLMGDNFDEEFAKTLSDAQLTALINLEPKEDGLKYTKEEIEDYLNPIEVTVDIENASELVSELDTLEDKWGSLETAYESSVTNGKTISATDLQSVTDDFGGIGADSEGNFNALSSSIENYNTKLVENPKDTEIAQNAADELATSYIDLAGVLENLTEDQAEYAEDILYANGVENAHEVVQSRLNKTYKETRKNLQTLAEVVAEYTDELEKSNKTADDFDPDTGQFADITKSVANLIGEYNQETGEFVKAADIDGQFMADNWSLVEDAINGVDGAVDSLYNKLALYKAEQILIEAGLDTSQIDSGLSYIDQMLAIASTWTMEPEALLNNSQFMSALNACWDGSVSTANAINAALSTIGMKVQYKTTTKKIRVAKGSDSNAHTVYGGENAGKVMTADTIEVDDFEIVSTPTGKGSSGTGVKNYGGSSSSSNSGGGSGGGSGSDSSDDTEETFDWIEVAIDRVEEKIEDLGKTADDVYDIWSNRNQAVADQIDKVTDEIELQTQAAKRYKKEAESINLSQDYKDKIQEGKLDIETVTDQDTIDAINDYTDWWNKYKEAEDNAKTLTLSLGDYQKTLFENIETYYDDLITNIEKKVDRIDEQITRTEEFGFFVDRSYYDQQIKLEEQTYNNLASKRNELINKLNEGLDKGYIKPYSETWNDMYQSIMDVNIAMEESATNTRKLNNEIRQLEWDKFDWIEERMSDFATEADFLIKILQGENNYLDDGNFNNRGFAQAALVGAKYNDTLDKMLRYKEQIAEIDAKIAKDQEKYGTIDKENIARKEELVSEYRSAIEAAEDYKQEMQSLVQEGINKHLEALNELIEKYKESLSAEKDLYDWQKNVADQTKNIAELQKQLAAYEGDTSEEARKKRQELQSQLSSAQQSLEESQWDRYISETGELLDNMYGDYEDYLNGKLEEVKVLMDSMIGYINNNTTAVKNGIDEVKKEYGLTTQNFEGFAEGQTKLLNEWQDGKFVGDIAAVRTSLSNFYDTYVKISEKNTKDIIDTIGKVVVTDSEKGKVGVQEPKPANGNGTTPGGDPNKPGGTDTGKGLKDQTIQSNGWYEKEGLWHYRDGNGNDLTDTWKNDDGYWYYFDPGGVMLQDQFVEGYWLDDDGHMMPDKFSWHGDDSNGWWFGTDDEQQYVKGESVYIDGKWYDFDENGWLKYATGSRSIPHNQLAWTQEEGQELIYRTTDGALLTPLGQGDMVFTNAMTQRLWEIASGTTPFSSANLSAPDISSNLTQNVSAENTFNFNLPNVTNADEFIDELKNNERFEKIVQEVSIGRMMGNNKLNKYKY